MAVTPTDLGHGNLALTGTDIVSAASNYKVRVWNLTLSNIFSSKVTVNVYYLRSGESTSSNGTFLAQKTMMPGQSWICIEANKVLMESSSIHAVPSVNDAIHYNVSGDVIQ